MSAPLFSVITPSFNQANFIEDCVRSVLAQETEDFEHLVFDNCSTDGTLDILCRYPHVRVVSEPDHGQSHALNKGFAAARGQVICWLNADDRYAPGTFETVRRELVNAGRAVIFGNAREIFFDTRAERILRPRFEHRADLLRWWDKATYLLQPAVFFTREAFLQAGPLREDLQIVMDLEYWWRLSAVAPFYYVDEVLAIQLRQPDSKTMRSVDRMYREKQIFCDAIRRAEHGFQLREWLVGRREMSRRFHQLAQVSLKEDPDRVLEYLFESWKEDPTQTANLEWWKTLVCIFRDAQKR